MDFGIGEVEIGFVHYGVEAILSRHINQFTTIGQHHSKIKIPA